MQGARRDSIKIKGRCQEGSEKETGYARHDSGETDTRGLETSVGRWNACRFGPWVRRKANPPAAEVLHFSQV